MTKNTPMPAADAGTRLTPDAAVSKQPAAQDRQPAPKRRRSRSRRLVVAVTLAAAPWALQAQTATPGVPASVALPPVSVVSLHSVCPDLPDQLQDSLQRVIMERGLPGHTDVTLRLQGERVADVVTQGGPLAYQRAVRRVVKQAQCAMPGVQTLSFGVRYVDPWGRDGTGASASTAVMIVTTAQAR
jgi:hypothetical protein